MSKTILELRGRAKQAMEASTQFCWQSASAPAKNVSSRCACWRSKEGAKQLWDLMMGKTSGVQQPSPFAGRHRLGICKVYHRKTKNREQAYVLMRNREPTAFGVSRTANKSGVSSQAIIPPWPITGATPSRTASTGLPLATCSLTLFLPHYDSDCRNCRQLQRGYL